MARRYSTIATSDSVSDVGITTFSSLRDKAHKKYNLDGKKMVNGSWERQETLSCRDWRWLDNSFPQSQLIRAALRLDLIVNHGK